MWKHAIYKKQAVRPVSFKIFRYFHIHKYYICNLKHLSISFSNSILLWCIWIWRSMDNPWLWYEIYKWKTKIFFCIIISQNMNKNTKLCIHYSKKLFRYKTSEQVFIESQLLNQVLIQFGIDSKYHNALVLLWNNQNKPMYLL